MSLFWHASGWRVVAVLWAAAVVAACSGPAPDVGMLDPIYAKPAEDVQVLALEQGQTLGELLSGSIDSKEQYDLLLAFQQQASPRRMRPGTEITLRRREDDGWLRRVDVELSADQTVRLTRDGTGWSSRTIRTPTFVDTLYASGEIENSLWESVVDNADLAALPVADRVGLIDDLDRVFQWQMDFSRQIRSGDTYRFVFEEEVRPDGSLRSGKLLAAEMVNAGTSYYAVYFDPNGDGEGSYYDLDGKSVRRAFLLKPLTYRRISSRFSLGRYHPILHRIRAHKGIDYAANTGTPVMATADGVVTFRGRDGGYGNLIELRHPNGWRTRYGHLSGYARGLHVGSRVHQGDVIGYVGMTGLATGPHLHYEMLRHGAQIDPLSVDLPAGDPVPNDAEVRWEHALTGRMALLRSIPGAGPVRSTMATAETAADPPPPEAQRAPTR